MPVASKTSEPKRWSPGASGLNTAASSPASAAALRSGPSSGVDACAPASATVRASASASRPPGAAPSSTGPSTAGAPGSQRSSLVGRGRPTRPATKLPGGELTSCA